MAADSLVNGIPASSIYIYTFGIIIGSILITIIFTGFAYLTLRCLKKRRGEPDYYVDGISIEKEPPEYHKEAFDVVPAPPESELVQIQPILTVSEVVSSVKQSLEVLGHTIIPKRWSTVQPMTSEEKPASEI